MRDRIVVNLLPERADVCRRSTFEIRKTDFEANFIHDLIKIIVFFQILKYLSFDKITNWNDMRSKVQHEFTNTLTCNIIQVKVHMYVHYIY